MLFNYIEDIGWTLGYGYTLTILLLVMLYVIVPSKRPLLQAWLSLSHLLMLVCFAATIYSALSHYMYGYGSFNDTRFYDTTFSEKFAHVPFYTRIRLAALCICFVLCLFRRLRRSYFLALAILPAFYCETIYHQLYPLYVDFLPSGWAIYTPFPLLSMLLFSLAVFTVVVLVMYLVARRFIRPVRTQQ